MTCAAHCCAIQSQFDQLVAQRDLTDYRRKGPSQSTRQLLAYARQADIAGMTVLDVGGGVGVIAHELLAAGAASATSTFRNAAIDSALRRAGLTCRSSSRGIVWVVALYGRSAFAQ